MEKTLSLEVLQEGDTGVLVANGYINNMGGEQIATACDDLMEKNVIRFVFDLEQCRIVNSIGISILIEVIEEVVESGGKVLFCVVSPTISKTFRIMGLLQMSGICDTRDEALQQLSR